MAETQLSAVISLKDQISAPLRQVQANLNDIRSRFSLVQKTASASLGEVGTQVKNIASGFGHLDASASKFLGKTANLTNRLLGVALAAQGLAGNNSSLKAASEGLQTFAGIALALPGPVGLTVGALAGLAVAFKQISTNQKEAAEKAKEFKFEMQQMQRDLFEARGQFLAKLATAKNPALAEVESQMESIKEQIGTAYGKLSQAQTGMFENKSKPLSHQFLAAKESAQDAQEKIDELTKKLGELRSESDRLTLGDKLKELQKESESTKLKIDFGVITPLEGAEQQLRLTEKAIDDLSKAQESMPTDQFSEKLRDLVSIANEQRKIIDAAKDSKEVARARGSVDDFETRSGILLSEDTKARLAELGKESHAKLHEALERVRSEAESDPMRGLELALADLTKQSFNFRDAWRGIFADISEGISNAFADSLTGAKKFSAAFRDIGKDLLRSMIKMFVGGMTQSALGGMAGGLMGLLAPGSATPVATLSAGGQQSSNGGVNLSSIAGVSSGLGLSSATMTALGGAVAGGAIAAGGIQSGNTTQSTVGGAMAGAALGTMILPGIGTAVGLVAGALAGFIGGSRAKRRARKKRREAEAQALAAHQAAVKKAGMLLKTDIRSRLSGGLATEDAAASVGQLFSEDLSESELNQFGGAAAINAREGEITKQANITNHIQITAEIAGSYDVARLSRDLGYYMANEMHGLLGSD